MPILVQINSFDGGSTGSIAKQINLEAENNGFQTYLFFGRFWRKTNILSENQYKISNKLDCLLHLIQTRLFDTLGLGSIYSTKKLIKLLNKINPDIVHLHNIHGYYINYPILFKYLKSKGIKVVWTLHDCWSFTGHCSHFDLIQCNKWQTKCFKCPLKKEYPKSLFLDNSKKNYILKKKYFTSLGKNLILVPVSYWLKSLLEDSFFKSSDSKTIMIHNGIDLNIFRPQTSTSIIEKYKLENKITLVGVANPWSERKGLYDFYKLREYLPDKYKIILVGLSKKQISDLPLGILGIEKINDVNELVEIYSAADIFINTTYEDNYPTVNLESIACGTPVITYNTGGSSESITQSVGRVVTKGNIKDIITAIQEITKTDKEHIRKACRNHAEQNFSKHICFEKYINLYNDLLQI